MQDTSVTWTWKCYRPLPPWPRWPVAVVFAGKHGKTTTEITHVYKQPQQQGKRSICRSIHRVPGMLTTEKGLRKGGLTGQKEGGSRKIGRRCAKRPDQKLWRSPRKRLSLLMLLRGLLLNAGEDKVLVGKEGSGGGSTPDGCSLFAGDITQQWRSIDRSSHEGGGRYGSLFAGEGLQGGRRRGWELLRRLKFL